MTIDNRLFAFICLTAITLSPVSAVALDAPALYHERTCIACHGSNGREPAMDDYPKLAGQSEEYLLTQMRDIKNGSRSNAHSIAMKNVMHLISDEEMSILAKWLAKLPE
ncbi:MAG: c-type cytochrome [gamma proteobacterium symbiont of Ctena orbiculata]|nr:c-type cytochrome [Candidatus Thiodiazotropha sp. (ex Lucina pensylvanica)]MBT3063544.1 c-type cytochrome [Candidatus Thiodiazotropha sp. (ex Lucina pensylvanica)]MBV2094947.1 c-type cytochrome [Candidatus Thiodiazotropha sp. (ex Codakia orbicularis)]PUB74105.1 MAG: cytochrome C [gamma proteobacterium symbiont of Ctena orbiculata]PUB75995.1 MAG: cytochrome C [gamma proteobacterium symbiont of Ctena orbiculata]